MLLVSISISSGCGKKKDDNKNSNQATGKVNLNMTLNVDANSFASSRLNLASGNGVFDDLPLSPSASESGLSSLKLYFREIKLCTSLKFSSGTGYQVDGTCATIYSNLTDEYTGTEAPTSDDRTKFAAAADGKFYDLLSKDDLAQLNKPSSIPTGSYNYGIIETHPWVKFKAKNGTICTKAAGSKENTATGSDGIKTYYTSADSFSCGASDAPEELLGYITNANSTFKFLKPFVVEEGQESTVDLAFNLDSEVKTIKGGDPVPGCMRDGAQNCFYVPMLRLGAAPRKANETTKVETYYLGTASDKERIRIHLYYNSADSTKTIIGVSSTVLATPASTKTKANNPVYINGVTQTGDEVEFTAWDNTTVLKFTRGVAGTATISCVGNGGGTSLEGCAGQTQMSLTYAVPTQSDL
jgi:hypothetical protein